MKNNRLIKLVALATVLLSLLAIAVFADDLGEGTIIYFGTIEGAEKKLAELENYEDYADQATVLDGVIKYLTTVDPTSEGYADFILKLDRAELGLAKAYLDAAENADTNSAKHTYLSALKAFVQNHSIESTTMLENSSFTGADVLPTLNASACTLAQSYLTASLANVDKLEKRNNLDAIEALIAEFTPSLEEDFIVSFKAENLACLNLFFDAVDKTDITTYGATVRQVKSFLKYHTFDVQAQGYVDFIPLYNALLEDYQSAFANIMYDTSLSGKASDFAYVPQVFLGFDDVNSDKGLIVNEEATDSNGNLITRIGVESGADGDNVYYTTHYDVSKHIRPNIYFGEFQNCAVLEVDITTFDRLPKGGLAIEDLGVFDTNRWYVRYLVISEAGDILSSNDKRVLVKGGITKGEWTHLSFVVDLQTADVKIYVDYMHVDTVNGLHKNGYTYSPYMLRISSNPGVPGGEFSIDNLVAYEGYSPRDLNAFGDMDNAELFNFYVTQAENTARDSSWRYDYFIAAGELMQKVADNPDCAEYVARYEAIDKDVLINEAMSLNLDTFRSKMDALIQLGHSEGSHSRRVLAISQLQNYLDTYSGKILTGEDYDALTRSFMAEQSVIEDEDILTEFVRIVNEFYLAITLTSQNELYSAALVTLGMVDYQKYTDATAYPLFCDALERSLSMEQVLYENGIIENSKKLLSSLNFLKVYNSPEIWENEYEYLRPFVSEVVVIIEDGAYDGYYGSINDTIKYLEPMFEFFKTKIQDNYVAELTNLLCTFENEQIYFKKYIACANFYVVIQKNDIDIEDERIAALIAQNDANYASLTEQEDSYEKLLVENTKVFIEKCNSLVGSVDYLTMKSVIAEAEIYYFSMNVEEAGVRDAVDIFFARVNEVERIEKYAAYVVMSIEFLKNIPEDDALLAAIVECAPYVNDVEYNVAGVKEALEDYNEILDAYNARISGVNAELSKVYSAPAYLANNNFRENLATLILLECLK